MAKKPKVRLAVISVCTQTEGPEGEVIAITLRVRAEDLDPFLRSIAPNPSEDPALVLAWMMYVLSQLKPPLDGRPKETDPDELLRDYDEFRETRKNPRHGIREFARHRGAETEDEIRAVAQAVRRALKGVARNST